MDRSNSIRHIVSQNLKRLRKERGLTQAELAERADVSNTYIANIECEKAWLSDKTLEKFVAALSIAPHELFVSVDEGQQAEKISSSKQTLLLLDMFKKNKNNMQKDLKKLVDTYFAEMILATHMSK